MATNPGKPDDITVWQQEFEAPIPEGIQPRELAYQRDEATVMRWYKPDPADPWTSFLDSAVAKRSGLG